MPFLRRHSVKETSNKHNFWQDRAVQEISAPLNLDSPLLSLDHPRTAGSNFDQAPNHAHIDFHADKTGDTGRSRRTGVSVKELADNLASAQSEVKGLEEELDGLKDKHRGAINQLNRLRKEKTFGLADDELKSNWDNIFYDIKNWAHSHLKTPNRNRTVQPAHLVLRSTLAPVTESFLANRDFEPVFGQAFVWEALDSRVFSNAAGWAWTGGLCDPFKSLHEAIEPSM